MVRKSLCIGRIFRCDYSAGDDGVTRLILIRILCPLIGLIGRRDRLVSPFPNEILNKADDNVEYHPLNCAMSPNYFFYFSPFSPWSDVNRKRLSFSVRGIDDVSVESMTNF